MGRESGSITFDVVGDTMNTWTEEAFTGFDQVMRELEISKGVRGVIFISGKPENFLAGANLKTDLPDRERRGGATDVGPIPRIVCPP